MQTYPNLIDNGSLELAQVPNPDLVHLLFSGENNPEGNVPSIESFGITTLHALANLEQAIIQTFGIEASFSNEEMFCTSQPLQLLAAEGGVYERNDFSTPESNYRITRLANGN
jgi:hypothetical protein